MRGPIYSFTLLIFLAAGCAEHDSATVSVVPQEYLNALPGAGQFSGAQAARHSISQRNFTALAVGQDCVVVPVFSQGCNAPAAYAGHPIIWRLIPQTSDVITKVSFQEYAERFAHEYNTELATYFRQYPNTIGFER